MCLHNDPGLLYKKQVLNSSRSIEVVKLVNLINNVINLIFISENPYN